MKKLIFFLFCFASLSFCYGQEKKEEHSQLSQAYCCIKNDYCGEKGKKCPKCDQVLIREGLFYCPKCTMSRKKPGTCGRCDMVLVKMERKSELLPADKKSM